MLNKEVFLKDPTKTTIPNDGVAEVTEPTTPEQWDVLRWELGAFVCDGAYREGLHKILSTYMKNLGGAKQPASWVSGFYGSGKSHLVRMLEFLWRDVTLPGGATARSLTNLSPDVADLLTELSQQGKRSGGLWSAAGRLGSGASNSVRLALTNIVFRSAGLPEDYAAAKFVLYLHRNNFFDTVKTEVEAQGENLYSELAEMYVSSVLANAILKAHPGFAANELQVRETLRAQYPPLIDITEEQMITVLTEIFQRQSNTPGKMPCVLIVLDEMQQYLGEDDERIQQVGLMVEACSSRFGSQLLFVATGQSALIASPHIAKLQGRFTVQVMLAETDVEKVIREIVLQKSPVHIHDVDAALNSHSGEIDRQLSGTRIASATPDKAVWVADYPLLPVRRRFWEKVLRAVDRAGTAGQLRTQLRVVHDEVQAVAEKPLGFVVAADRLYDQIASQMMQNNVLLRDTHESILRQNDGTEDGKLKSRLLKTIFLIGQVAGADPTIGIQSTDSVLADLLVEDLNIGSPTLRKQIPILLQELAASGVITLIGTEYRLQTIEGAEWEQAYRGHYQKANSDDHQIASDRNNEIRNICKKVLPDLKFPQGTSKTPRTAVLHFNGSQPTVDASNIPVWIRDDWDASEKQVKQSAQDAGQDSPIVFVHLPRRNADALKAALAGLTAATATLGRPTPTTPGGIDAKASMETRRYQHRTEIDSLLNAILHDARVFQGGGNEVVGSDLNAAVKAAVLDSLVRLYPQFSLGDNDKWGLVISRIKQGNTDPLSVLPYTGNVNEQPVCQKILAEVGPGKKGSEIRTKFMSAPFGWPKDTVEGALLALLAGTFVSAKQNGVAVAPNKVDQSSIGTTEFKSEVHVVTAAQKIAVRGLLQNAGINAQGNEAVALPGYLADLKKVANEAGGAAPLPVPPDTSDIDDLLKLSGNELLIAVFNQKDELSQKRVQWQATQKQAISRMQRWTKLEALLNLAKSLPVHAEIAPLVAAIKSGRSLLQEPDPVPALCTQVTDALRLAISAARDKHVNAYDDKVAVLEADSTWQKLDEASQNQIKKSNGLSVVPVVALGTEDEVLAAATQTPLPEWDSKTDAIAERVGRCLLDAAKLLEPKTVRVILPSVNINGEAELDAYLADVRKTVMAYLDAGTPVVI